MGIPPNPLHYHILGGSRRVFSKVFIGFQTSDMTSKGLGEMFEGDSADMCAGKFTLLSIGGRAEGLACANPGVRTVIGEALADIGPSVVRAPAVST